MNTKTHGFTLLELMITISIAAIIMALGVPGFQDFMRNNRRTSAVNELLAEFQIARSESISRNARIGICASTDNATCANSTVWDTGWITWVDTDADGVLDVGESVIRNHEAILQIDATSDFQRIAYRPNGRVVTYSTDGTAGDIILCDERGATYARAIVIPISGRPKSSTEQGDGSALVC